MNVVIDYDGLEDDIEKIDEIKNLFNRAIEEAICLENSIPEGLREEIGNSGNFFVKLIDGFLDVLGCRETGDAGYGLDYSIDLTSVLGIVENVESYKELIEKIKDAIIDKKEKWEKAEAQNKDVVIENTELDNDSESDSKNKSSSEKSSLQDTINSKVEDKTPENATSEDATIADSETPIVEAEATETEVTETATITESETPITETEVTETEVSETEATETITETEGTESEKIEDSDAQVIKKRPHINKHDKIKNRERHRRDNFKDMFENEITNERFRNIIKNILNNLDE